MPQTPRAPRAFPPAGVVPALFVLAAIACATPAREARAPTDVRVVEECRDFAEQTVPTEPVRGNGHPRSTVYPSQNPESLRTLFDLCMKAKEALK